MRKFLIFIGTIICIWIVLSMFISFIPFIIGCAIMFLGVHFYKQGLVLYKLLGIVIGIIGMIFTIKSSPVIVGMIITAVIVIVLLYLFYKPKPPKVYESRSSTSNIEEFKTFEEDWKKIMDKHK